MHTNQLGWYTSPIQADESNSANSITFSNTPGREAKKQPINQLVKQAVRKARRQESRKHPGFFSGTLGYKQWGALLETEQSTVAW